jgi:hypothetical protein
MTTTQTVITVIVVLVVLAAVVMTLFMARRAALRRRFGPEYDRAVADNDGRLSAERDLRARERRHAQLELRPLSDAARQQFTQQWQAVQAQFITDPAGAVVAGDDLVTRLIAQRGYPTTGYEEQLSYLSVEHARTLGNYRDAHEIYLRGQRGEASTEQLRQALVHYRSIFADLLDEAPSSIVDTSGSAATDRQSAESAPNQAAPRPNQPYGRPASDQPTDTSEEVRHGRR